MLGLLSLKSNAFYNGYTALNPNTLHSAVSTAAQDICRTTWNIIKDMERSQILFGKKAVVISELWELADECGEDEWDGEGACALDFTAVQNAENFVRVFPDNLPAPDVSPEPDGSISLDWIVSRHRLFSLSIGAGNRLAFAWLDGSDTGHGVARFDGTTVPVRILDGIRALFGI